MLLRVAQIRQFLKGLPPDTLIDCNDKGLSIMKEPTPLIEKRMISRNAILAMYDKGMKQADIARKFEVSRQSVNQLILFYRPKNETK